MQALTLQAPWFESYSSFVFSLTRPRVLNVGHIVHTTRPQDFPIRMNDLIAGRYQVMDFLGSAAFSRAVQALDVRTNTLVCLKVRSVEWLGRFSQLCM